jgi:lipid A ethanolaminephosphotransferase
MVTSDCERRFDAKRAAGYAAKLIAIALFVWVTNTGIIQRVDLLVGQGRWGTLVGFAGVWGLSLAALLAAAFQGSRWLRVGWALVIGFSTAVGFAYHKASGSQFGVLDALSLWNARHEATRAAEFYAADLYWLVAVLAAGVIVFAMPPAPHAGWARRWLTRFGWLPAVPVAAIAAIIMIKEGGGTEALPTQFEPLSVGLVMGSKVSASPLPQRRAVSLPWRGPFEVENGDGVATTPIRRIVLLVDESVRGDYIDWTPGNPYTPQLARLKDRIVDFGPAASGGNCSHYANAILRFAARQDGIGRAMLSNPTLWQYARKAGFRTVFIDGQSAFNRNSGKLQNFMTAAEVRDIDAFHTLDADVPPPLLDDRLADIVLRELEPDKPVLIYANKNGAHFPYDVGYPDKARVFGPTMSEAEDASDSRIRSYRNVLRWSVDRVMRRLIEQAPLEDTVIIYTSDHGQAFDPQRFTHCSVEHPDPREGLVPLFVITGNRALRAQLQAAADASRGHGSHFSIAPTVLQLLGYDRPAVAETLGPSLLTRSARTPEFTSGDVFGLFSEKANRHPLDLTRNYLEPAAHPAPAAPEAHTAQAIATPAR